MLPDWWDLVPSGNESKSSFVHPYVPGCIYCLPLRGLLPQGWELSGRTTSGVISQLSAGQILTLLHKVT